MNPFAALPRAQAAGLVRYCALLVLTLCTAQAQPSNDGKTPGAPSSGHRNQYLAGAAVQPAGPVSGDLTAVGGRVLIDQRVAGDALLAGGSVSVRAPVDDDVRAAGGDVTIESAVGGELMAAAGSLLIAPTARIGQGAVLAGGIVTLNGEILGDVTVNAQRIVLNGRVSGDARLVGERVELAPTARIEGSLSHDSPDFSMADGAVVVGPVTHGENRPGSQRHPGPHGEWRWKASAPGWAGMLATYVALLAAGALFVLLFPKLSAEAPDEIPRAPGLALAIGLGVLAGVPLLAVLLFITLLGIPLGILTFMLYPLLMLLGYLAGIAFLAQRARLRMSSQAKPASAINTIGFMALALLAVMLIGLLPMVGHLVALIVMAMGLGACVLAWRHRSRGSPPVAAA